MAMGYIITTVNFNNGMNTYTLSRNGDGLYECEKKWESRYEKGHTIRDIQTHFDYKTVLNTFLGGIKVSLDETQDFNRGITESDRNVLREAADIAKRFLVEVVEGNE